LAALCNLLERHVGALINR